MDRIAELKEELKQLNDDYKRMLLEDRQTPGKNALGLNAIGGDVSLVLKELEALGVSEDVLAMEGLLE